MRQRVFISLFLFAASASFAFAQQAAQPFDPVPFFSRLRVGQEWAEGMFFRPSGTMVSMADSILDNHFLMAVTMHIDDPDSTGWKLNMFFDADRYGRPRLVRGFGRRHMLHPMQEDFIKLATRVDTVMRQKVTARQDASPQVVTWRWLQKEDYVLTLGRMDAADGSAMYFLALDRKTKNEK